MLALDGFLRGGDPPLVGPCRSRPLRRTTHAPPRKQGLAGRDNIGTAEAANGVNVGPPRDADPAELERHQLRGQQGVGEQDRAVRDGACLHRLSRKFGEQLMFDIPKIVDALDQQIVAGRTQGGRAGFDCGTPGEAGAAACGNAGLRGGNQFGVFK